MNFTDISTVLGAWNQLCGTAATSWNRSISTTDATAVPVDGTTKCNLPDGASAELCNQYDAFGATDYGALLPICAYDAGSTAT